MNTPSETAAIELDELVVTVIVDNETDNLSSVDAGIPRLPEVVSLLGRIAPTRQHRGHDCTPVFHELCVACHGLSVLLDGRRGDERHTVLFDVGPYGDVWLDNARRLGLDLSTIETVVLSHWHWDHSGALPAVVAAVAAARHAAGLTDPVVADLHPDRPHQRGIRMPWGGVVMLPEEPTLEQIRETGGAVDLRRDAHLVGGGFFHVSGDIPRVTPYETGLDGHVTFSSPESDGDDDPEIRDERFVAARVRGRGTSVFSACSHAGIVNACFAARQTTPDAPIDLVLGGFHLAGANVEGRIADTVADLADRIDPRIVAPGHCTGWRAQAALAAQFAPGRLAPSTVGATYYLNAAG